MSLIRFNIGQASLIFGQSLAKVIDCYHRSLSLDEQDSLSGE